jgi:hypothetical protein
VATRKLAQLDAAERLPFGPRLFSRESQPMHVVGLRKRSYADRDGVHFRQVQPHYADDNCYLWDSNVGQYETVNPPAEVQRQAEESSNVIA